MNIAKRKSCSNPEKCHGLILCTVTAFAMTQRVHLILPLSGEGVLHGCVWAAGSAKGKKLTFSLQENVKIPTEIPYRTERVR